MKIHIILSMFLLLCSCLPKKEVPIAAEEPNVKAPFETNSNLVDQICTPNSEKKAKCHEDIQNADIAYKSYFCTPDGGKVLEGECIVETCKQGTTLISNSCLPTVCNPGESHEENCQGEIPGSAEATRAISCIGYGVYSGMGSQCQLKACASTHFKVGNTCQPKSCVGESEIISCTNEVSNSKKAVKVKTCQNEGRSYSLSICEVVECNDDFTKVGNTCVPKVCNENSTEMISCTDSIPNSKRAERQKTCSVNGDHLVYSSCNLLECKNDFIEKNGYCVPKVCQPGANIQVSCQGSIQDAQLASMNLKCNEDGSAQAYGSCELIKCLPGFYREGNSCKPQVCSPNSKEKRACEHKNASFAVEEFLCNENGSVASRISDCKVEVCRDGFYKSGNTCLPQVCIPNTLTKESCSVVGAGSGSDLGVRYTICDAEGKQKVPFGECKIKNCLSGYYLDENTNSCKPQVCTPNTSIDNSCELPNARTAMKSQVCNADGSDLIQSLGSCKPIECSDGYVLNNDQTECIEELCSAGSEIFRNCLTSNDDGMTSYKKRYICQADGEYKQVGSCEATCMEGFVLNETKSRCIKSEEEISNLGTCTTETLGISVYKNPGSVVRYVTQDSCMKRCDELHEIAKKSEPGAVLKCFYENEGNKIEKQLGEFGASKVCEVINLDNSETEFTKNYPTQSLCQSYFTHYKPVLHNKYSGFINVQLKYNGQIIDSHQGGAACVYHRFGSQWQWSGQPALNIKGGLKNLDECISYCDQQFQFAVNNANGDPRWGKCIVDDVVVKEHGVEPENKQVDLIDRETNETIYSYPAQSEAIATSYFNRRIYFLPDYKLNRYRLKMVMDGKTLLNFDKDGLCRIVTKDLSRPWADAGGRSQRELPSKKECQSYCNERKQFYLDNNLHSHFTCDYIKESLMDIVIKDGKVTN